MKNKCLICVFNTIIFLFFVAQLYAQDTLILKSGNRIPYTKLTEYTDAIEIKSSEGKAFLSFPQDSIYGISQPFKELSFFLKLIPDSDTTAHYEFVERLEVGKVSLYQYTRKNLDLYLEKDGKIEHVYNSIERKTLRDQKLSLFESFFSDDEESMTYIQSVDFKFRLKEILVVLTHYNKRNFEKIEAQDRELRGSVFLYRTPFQKTKEGLKIRVNGEKHDLYINDYIRLDLPISFASKLSITDGTTKSTKILAGKLESQYYEVLYDRRSDNFIFDEKKGSELQFEFFNIRDKVDKKVEKNK